MDCSWTTSRPGAVHRRIGIRVLSCAPCGRVKGNRGACGVKARAVCDHGAIRDFRGSRACTAVRRARDLLEARVSSFSVRPERAYGLCLTYDPRTIPTYAITVPAPVSRPRHLRRPCVP